ncbi:ATP-binding protein [Spirosoma harenae]
MKHYISTLFLICFTLVNGFGQAAWPPTYPIISDTAYWQKLSPAYWQILEDKSDKWALDDIIKRADQFRYQNDKNRLDTISHTYWFRYRIKNKMPREARINLNSVSDYDDFYVSDSSKTWKHYQTGSLSDWDKKDGFKGADIIPIVLQPQDELTIYQRIHNQKPGLDEKFEIALTGTDSVVKKYYVDYVDRRLFLYAFSHLEEALMIGILLITAVFNLFFYATVKEKMYLHFSLFLLFLAFNRTTNIAISYANWGRRDLLDNLPLFYSAWIFITYFLIQFFRHALKTFATFPKWDKFFVGLMILLILNQVLSIAYQVKIIPIRLAIPEAQGLLLFGSLLVTLLLYNKRRDAFYLTFMAASLPYILLNLSFTALMFSRQFRFNFREWELGCIIWLVVLFAFNLFLRFNNLQKENAQKSIDNERLAKEKEIERNQLIAAQNETLEIEVARRTAELEQSLAQLKTTQSQLIQSEKLASLGELTAGIAHEIQNPLNFVNNFSEVSAELVDEMHEELAKGDLEEVRAIADDVKQNLQRINHHGKRADSIVKGMLEHSRASTGQKEPTDLHALTEEYLRLAYHSLLAKNKLVTCELVTDFDSTLPDVPVVAQDFGRVLLNLFNNAFYAVEERARSIGPGVEYQPTVWVSTDQVNGQVIIRVRDNGPGMPDSIKAKIFQPFFTTKPTGQGTGLGLSLSYDIITKGHNGSLLVQSQPGEGTQFTIELPV